MGFSILLLAGAAWLHAADFFFTEWARTLQPANSPGGVIGDGLGGFVLMNLIGRAGTLIVTGAAYLVAVILLTGQQPVRFTKACFRLATDEIRRLAGEPQRGRQGRRPRGGNARRARTPARAAPQGTRSRQGRRRQAKRRTPIPRRCCRCAKLPRRRSSMPPSAVPASRWCRAPSPSSARKPAISFYRHRVSRTTSCRASICWMPTRKTEAPEANRDELLSTQRRHHRDAQGLRHRGHAGRHHPRPDHHPLRDLSVHRPAGFAHLPA